MDRDRQLAKTKADQRGADELEGFLTHQTCIRYNGQAVKSLDAAPAALAPDAASRRGIVARMRSLAVALVLVASLGHAEAGPKNRQTARVLSGASAGVAGAVTLAGFLTTPEGEAFNEPVLFSGIGLLMVAPSAGEFYSGQYLTYGMAVRAAATGLAVYTLETQTRAVRCDEVGASHELECESFTRNAYPLLGIAAIAFIGGVWYDTLDAADSADRYNARHGFTVTPTVMPGPQGLAPGLSLGGAF